MLHIAVTACQAHDRETLLPALTAAGHVVTCVDALSTPASAASLRGFDAVCGFVGDQLDAPVQQALASAGVRLIVQRAAGIDNVALDAARDLGLRVAHVPAYSPESVAEHAAALLLAWARQLPRALEQVRRGNFGLEGLRGFSLHGKTVGIVGMGRIGQAFARIARGFGCRVLGHSRSAFHCEGVEQVPLATLWQDADIVSLHCPLTPETFHLVDAETLARCRPGLVLVNTARGGVVETAAVLAALDTGQLGGYLADVYENEACVFFRDCSDCGYDDPLLARLIAHPRTLVTPHQAFFTVEALRQIAASVTASCNAFARGESTPAFVV